MKKKNIALISLGAVAAILTGKLIKEKYFEKDEKEDEDIFEHDEDGLDLRHKCREDEKEESKDAKECEQKEEKDKEDEPKAGKQEIESEIQTECNEKSENVESEEPKKQTKSKRTTKSKKTTEPQDSVDQ